MSLSTELDNLAGYVEDSYEAVSAKGGTIPAVQSLHNLSTAIGSITTSFNPVGVISYDYINARSKEFSITGSPRVVLLIIRRFTPTLTVTGGTKKLLDTSTDFQIYQIEGFGSKVTVSGPSDTQVVGYLVGLT